MADAFDAIIIGTGQAGPSLAGAGMRVAFLKLTGPLMGGAFDMRSLLKVPKVELDAMVKSSKERSPRVGNPNAAGRKKTS